MPKPRKPPKDLTTPMYTVWARDVEDDAAAEYGALGVREAAEIHARYGHSSRDFYECTWPLVFCVIDPHGKTWVVEVEREMVPEFRPSFPVALAELAPALHIVWNGSQPMCRDIRIPQGHSNHWPAGQYALHIDKVTDEKLEGDPPACPTCVEKYRAHKAFLADVAERRKEIDAERERRIHEQERLAVESGWVELDGCACPKRPGTNDVVHKEGCRHAQPT